MNKGKWFLEYKYDGKEHFSSDPHFHHNPTQTELVDLGGNIKNEAAAMRIAKRKWKGIISHKPSAAEVAITGGQRDLRDPVLVYRIKTDFPVPTPKKDPLEKMKWL